MGEKRGGGSEGGLDWKEGVAVERGGWVVDDGGRRG